MDEKMINGVKATDKPKTRIYFDLLAPMKRKIQDILNERNQQLDGFFWQALRHFWDDVMDNFGGRIGITEPIGRKTIALTDDEIEALDTMAVYLRARGRTDVFRNLYYYLLGMGFFKNPNGRFDGKDTPECRPITLEELESNMRGKERIHPRIAELIDKLDDLNEDVELNAVHGAVLKSIIRFDVIYRGAVAHLFICWVIFQDGNIIHHVDGMYEKVPVQFRMNKYFKSKIGEIVDDIAEWIGRQPIMDGNKFIPTVVFMDDGYKSTILNNKYNYSRSGIIFRFEENDYGMHPVVHAVLLKFIDDLRKKHLPSWGK